uniref:BZIP domain-containing protein n=1 Tax=Ditylenchus dipsaci TaxID=166011 RepID=A0A915E7R8_9BILA
MSSAVASPSEPMSTSCSAADLLANPASSLSTSSCTTSTNKKVHLLGPSSYLATVSSSSAPSTISSASIAVASANPMDIMSLETPQLLAGVSPSTMTTSNIQLLVNGMSSASGQHVPSTAEIIQKCLTVNPFDLKFREANMQQINSGGSQSQGQSPTDQNGLLGSSMGLPSMLSKFPSLSSQSPGIFSNISMLSTANFDEMRKNIDLTSFSRKVQQLRESRDEANRTGREPRTADVIDGVIDVEFNRNHHMSPSSLSTGTSQATSNANLVAVAAVAQDFLQAATAYGNQLAAVNAAAASGASSMAISCAPSTSSATSFQNTSSNNGGGSGLGNMIDVLTCQQQNQHNNQQQQQQQLSCITSTNSMTNDSGLHPNFGASGFQFSSPTGLRKSTLPQFSHADFAATTAAFLQQQQQQQQNSSMVSKLPAETLMALHSSAAAAAAASNINLTVPQIMTTGCSSERSSPANVSVSNCHGTNSAAISPRSNSNLTELKKASSTADLLLSGISSIESHHSASSAPSTIDPWENSMDVKPTLTNKQISSLQQHPSQSFYHQSQQDNNPFHPNSSGQDQNNQKSHSGQRPDKPRKYTRYNHATSGASSADSQVTSTRGGRGRRSLTSEMPPDERRNTILERNKAAAVRYRKRKKEEHDDMISRVQELQNEKTRNEVLVREIERLSNLLKAKDAQCVCRANRLGVLGDGGHEDAIRRPGNSPIDFGMSNVDALSMMNSNSSNINLNQLNTGGFRNK